MHRIKIKVIVFDIFGLDQGRGKSQTIWEDESILSAPRRSSITRRVAALVLRPRLLELGFLLPPGLLTPRWTRKEIGC